MFNKVYSYLRANRNDSFADSVIGISNRDRKTLRDAKPEQINVVKD